jgi:hypothetical protein
MMKFEYVFPGEATEASELAIVRPVYTFIIHRKLGVLYALAVGVQTT